VAYTTTPKTKALGYAIYYMLVNLGGALGPILAPSIRKRLGIEYVLVASSCTSAVLFLSTLLFFREPERRRAPGEGGDEPPPRTLRQVLKDLVMVLQNGKFVLFLVIFSGFWMMFWQIFHSLPFYIREVLRYPDFEPLLAADSLSIIVLTVAVTALTKRFRPILTMAAGFALASASWLIIPLSSWPYIVIPALVVFSLGEMLQAPRYYEYVADLAPKGQVGTYMGFAFLPVAIGSLISSFLAPYLVAHYMRGPRPASMWGAVAMIGFFTTILLVTYDRILHRDKRTGIV
jgi:Na+/melibiose symporter-like transporter